MAASFHQVLNEFWSCRRCVNTGPVPGLGRAAAAKNGRRLSAAHEFWKMGWKLPQRKPKVGSGRVSKVRHRLKQTGVLGVLRGLCEGFARALRGLCEGFARALRGLCEGFARALRGLCEGFARALRGLCEGFARALRGLLPRAGFMDKTGCRVFRFALASSIIRACKRYSTRTSAMRIRYASTLCPPW